MHFLKSLTILLVSVHADLSGNPSSPRVQRENGSSGNVKATSRGSFHLTHENGIDITKENIGKMEDETKEENPRQVVKPVTVQKSAKCTGTRKIVQCKDDVSEAVCKEDLIKSGVQVLSDMPKTVFFAICVDSESDAAIVAELTNVEGVEDDPPRTLSVVEGSMVKRRLQGFEQLTPYGVELVKAPEFWSRYNGNQGAGIKVCVIDSGLRLSHEDIRDGDVSGSEGIGLLSPVSYAVKCRFSLYNGVSLLVIQSRLRFSGVKMGCLMERM